MLSLHEGSGSDTAFNTITRREFFAASLLIPLGTAFGCRSTATDDSQIETIAKTFAQLSERDPALPGVRSVTQFRDNLSHMTLPADLEILTGALYLEAQRILQGGAAVVQNAAAAAPRTNNQGYRRPITESDVKAALARPIDTSAYGQDYIFTLLENTKRRLATDSQFGVQLSNAQAAVARKTCLGGTPRWICIGMIVVVVIGVILLL